MFIFSAKHPSGYIDYIGPFMTERDALNWLDKTEMFTPEMGPFKLHRLLEPKPNGDIVCDEDDEIVELSLGKLFRN